MITILCIYFSVALARLLFPVEAEVVMDLAKVEGTCEFTASSLEPDHHTGGEKTSLDLNMAPFRIQEKHLRRLKALSKTGMDWFLPVSSLFLPTK